MEKEYRPWGWYENLLDESQYKVKRLYIEPDQKISLQYHTFRDEYWVVVNGDGKLELEDQIKEINIGDYIFISKGSKHRITAGKCGIIIVEVQIGCKCKEDDIVRLEDYYGRV